MGVHYVAGRVHIFIIKNSFYIPLVFKDEDDDDDYIILNAARVLVEVRSSLPVLHLMT